MWFKANLLSLHFDKTQYLQFTTKSNMINYTKIGYDNKSITNTFHTKFLGLIIDNTLSSKDHTDLLTNKLSSICYMLRSIKTYMSHSALIMTYHSLFHSVMAYGIIFWGNSCHSQKIFKIQKRAIRIIMGCKKRESCRTFLKKLKILTLTAQYILSLLLFMVNNRNLS